MWINFHLNINISQRVPYWTGRWLTVNLFFKSQHILRFYFFFLSRDLNQRSQIATHWSQIASMSHLANIILLKTIVIACLWTFYIIVQISSFSSNLVAGPYPSTGAQQWCSLEVDVHPQSVLAATGPLQTSPFPARALWACALPWLKVLPLDFLCHNKSLIVFSLLQRWGKDWSVTNEDIYLSVYQSRL